MEPDDDAQSEEGIDDDGDGDESDYIYGDDTNWRFSQAKRQTESWVQLSIWDVQKDFSHLE